jgi:hypothetical protein
MFFNHLIDKSPIGQSAQVTVINEKIYFQFTGESTVLLFLFGIITIDSIEFHSSFFAPGNGFFQKLTFAHTP